VVWKFLVIVALMLSITPFLGVILALIALAGTYRYGGLWRILAFVALGIAIIASTVMGISLAVH
jgi:hypothetical protein